MNLGMSAADSDGNSVIYSASNLPSGLSIDPATGIISGTVSDGASLAGPYTVTVTATDSVMSSVAASQTFQWTINPLVTLGNPGSLTNIDGDFVTVLSSCSDSAGNALVFTATNLPPGLSIDPNTGIISGAVTAGDSIAGTYTVTMTATDSVNPASSASQTIQWAINPLVTLGNPGSLTNIDGDIVSVLSSCSDSAGNALVFTATNLPPGLSIDANTGIISGAVTAGDSIAGTYTVTMTATDSVNPASSASETFQWAVNPLVTLGNPGSLTNTDGDFVTVLSSCSDSAGNALVFTATNLPPGLSIDPNTGIISGAVTAGDSIMGTYTVTVTATDSVNPASSASQTFQWAINPLVTLGNPGSLTNIDGDFVTVLSSCSDSAGNALVFTATNLPPGLSIDPNTGIISGAVTAGDSIAGTYTVTMTATDSANPASSASETFQWTVNPLVTLGNPGSLTNSDGDSVSVLSSCSDSAGNALVFTATNLPPGLSIDPNTGIISGAVTAGDSIMGTYTVTVTATDSVNPASSASQAFQWTVNPLVTLTNPGAQTNVDGDNVTLSLSATDSAGNAVTYTAANLPPGLSIDPNAGTISGTVAAGADANGPYAVTVTATDSVDPNAAVSQSFQWVVNAS